MLKRLIKKILPKKALSYYHWFLAKAAAALFFYPSKKIIVIGVTGTNGKTTTVNLIAQLLECLGNKVALSSTVNFKIAEKEWLNDKKMTMLGRFQTQRLLRQAVAAGCEYMVIESSSQGVVQYRHLGINYDVMVFTNLTPEHLEAHGGFDNYRTAKEQLFKHLAFSKRKKIKNKKVKKIIISNVDDQESERLKKINTDVFFGYGFKNKADLQGFDLFLNNSLVEFKIRDKKIKTNLFGKFNAYNLLAGFSVVEALGLDFNKAIGCRLSGIPGRQEFIDCGQDFRVLIDYAPEPESLKHLYLAIGGLNYNKLIHVLGSCGGGRDKARQKVLGKMADEFADFVIITNEDPYDDDPLAIIEKIASGVNNKKEGDYLFKILDRKEAIRKALSLASEGDLVLITGKGAEQFICVANGKKVFHDDRLVVKKLLGCK